MSEGGPINNGVSILKRIELGLWTVAQRGIVLIGAITWAQARGDDAACVACDAEKKTFESQPGTLSASDAPSSFVATLNAERSKHGLQPVASRQNLEAAASQNNQWQASRGLGHHYLGGYGQCAAGPFATMAQALHAWLCSPAHRALILAPDLCEIGYHQLGAWHTVSTWQGVVTDDPAKHYYGSVAQFGMQLGTQPPKPIESKPAAPSPQSPSDSVSGQPSKSRISQLNKATTSAGFPQCVPSAPGHPVLAERIWPARRGFHPLQRLFGRLRVQVSFGVMVQF